MLKSPRFTDGSNWSCESSAAVPRFVSGRKKAFDQTSNRRVNIVGWVWYLASCSITLDNSRSKVWQGFGNCLVSMNVLLTSLLRYAPATFASCSRKPFCKEAWTKSSPRRCQRQMLDFAYCCPRVTQQVTNKEEQATKKAKYREIEYDFFFLADIVAANHFKTFSHTLECEVFCTHSGVRCWQHLPFFFFFFSPQLELLSK